MPISITGTGTITGISAGGLPDDCITTAEIAGSAVTPAKLSGAQTGSAPIYGARAWVNFDGTRDDTNTISTSNTNRLIRGSGNVSSVLRNGLGDYTITFATAMPDENYAAITSSGAAANTHNSGSTYATGSSNSTLRVTSANAAESALVDIAYFLVTVFR